MPMEGHWERTQTPLRAAGARQVKLAGIVAGVLVLACILGVYAVLAQPAARSAPGCVDQVAASNVGAVTFSACGGAARHMCLQYGSENSPFGHALAMQCRRQGYALR